MTDPNWKYRTFFQGNNLTLLRTTNSATLDNERER